MSALVHSSTLVTAGIYLLFRFNRLLIEVKINFFVILVGASTIFIARQRAIYELDIKKIVALSTLSQLGIIICALGAGLENLAFIHLLIHAFFKALLFIRTGRIIHISEGYQDTRIWGGLKVLPFSNSIVIGCGFRLIGLPFMSAFYSKELIIESLVIYNFSFYPYFIIVLGIFITILYRIRFFKNIFQFKRNKRLLFITDYNFIIRVRIILLFIPAISGGRLVTYIIDSSLIYFLIPKGIKRLIFLLVLRRIII